VIAREHLNVVATATLSCESGSSDIGRILPQLQSAVLQFRTQRVDTVVVDGIPAVVFAHEAEGQGWRPTYLMTLGGAGVGPNVPPGQAANMHGAGWFPAADVAPGHGPEPTAPQRRCLDLLASQGLKPSQYNDFVNMFTSCDALFLYEAALRATNGSTDANAIVDAITGFGDRYASASTLNGATRFSPGRRDGPAQYRTWGWSPPCACFVYQGDAQPMPPVP
jgi:hypothetical protein